MKEYKYTINGIKFNVEVGDVDGNQVEVIVNGSHYHVELEKDTKSPVKVNKAAAAPTKASGEKVISKPAAPSGAPGAVKAPLPGTIMSFKVKEGDTVNAGDTAVS